MKVGDAHKLSMYLDVNGKRCQTGSTATMIFNVPKIVSYRLRHHDADARRHHHHGYAARRRHGHEAAEIPRTSATSLRSASTVSARSVRKSSQPKLHSLSWLRRIAPEPAHSFRPFRNAP